MYNKQEQENTEPSPRPKKEEFARKLRERLEREKELTQEKGIVQPKTAQTEQQTISNDMEKPIKSIVWIFILLILVHKINFYYVYILSKIINYVNVYVFIIVLFSLSFVVAILGKKTNVGYSRSFFLSVFLSPKLGYIIILMSKDMSTPTHKNKVKVSVGVYLVLIGMAMLFKTYVLSIGEYKYPGLLHHSFVVGVIILGTYLDEIKYKLV